jgi:hypothetical protein
MPAWALLQTRAECRAAVFVPGHTGGFPAGRRPTEVGLVHAEDLQAILPEWQLAIADRDGRRRE